MINLSNKHGKLFVGPDQVGLAPIRLMIVGESPAHTEVEEKKPFVGYSGEILRNNLERLRLRQRGITYYITNAVKVAKFDSDDTNMNPTDDEIDKWRPLIHREIVVYNPTAVLMLGHSAYYSVMGEHAAPIKNVGSISKTFFLHNPDSPDLFDSCTPDLFFTYHPSSLRRDTSFTEHFKETLNHLMEILTNRIRSERK